VTKVPWPRSGSAVSSESTTQPTSSSSGPARRRLPRRSRISAYDATPLAGSKVSHATPDGITV
jgi:hypothetical protein